VTVNFVVNRDLAHAVVRDIEGAGGKAISVQADVSDPNAVPTFRLKRQGFWWRRCRCRQCGDHSSTPSLFQRGVSLEPGARFQRGMSLERAEAGGWRHRCLVLVRRHVAERSDDSREWWPDLNIDLIRPDQIAQAFRSTRRPAAMSGSTSQSDSDTGPCPSSAASSSDRADDPASYPPMVTTSIAASAMPACLNDQTPWTPGNANRKQTRCASSAGIFGRPCCEMYSGLAHTQKRIGPSRTPIRDPSTV
jgi:hypothetical protein